MARHYRIAKGYKITYKFYGLRLTQSGKKITDVVRKYEVPEMITALSPHDAKNTAAFRYPPEMWRGEIRYAIAHETVGDLASAMAEEGIVPLFDMSPYIAHNSAHDEGAE